MLGNMLTYISLYIYNQFFELDGGDRGGSGGGAKFRSGEIKPKWNVHDVVEQCSNPLSHTV